MEHLNRQLKDMMRNLGSNITLESVQHTSKVLRAITEICHNFKVTSEISPKSNVHSRPSLVKDIVQLQEQLKEQVFEVKQHREHQGFKRHRPLLLPLQKYYVQFICTSCAVCKHLLIMTAI